LTQDWPDEHIETLVTVLESQVRHWLASQGAAKQTEPQTFAFGQHVPPTQVLPEQQSLLPLHPSPDGTQLTQVIVVVSHTPEQQSPSLVQEPLFAIQQVPLLHVWALEQQALPHTLLVGQHDPATQVLVPVHASPLPQTQV
jgi:hypothetical protein